MKFSLIRIFANNQWSSVNLLETASFLAFNSILSGSMISSGFRVCMDGNGQPTSFANMGGINFKLQNFIKG